MTDSETGAFGDLDGSRNFGFRDGFLALGVSRFAASRGSGLLLGWALGLRKSRPSRKDDDERKASEQNSGPHGSYLAQLKHDLVGVRS